MLLDGLRRVPTETSILRADDLGVLRGESCFETLRIRRGRPAFLGPHLSRLAHSADRLGIDLPGGWEELAQAASEGVDDGVLRLVCTKGAPEGRPVGFALVTEVPVETVRARQHGVRAITLTLGVTAEQRDQAPWLLGGVKSTSYAVNMASLRQAWDQGVEDAIWISTDGEVLEAPTATVCVVLDGVLVTPPLAVGILGGTTLQAVRNLDLVPFVVRRLPVAELRSCSEILLLSSVRGVAPVSALDGRELGVGPVTVLLRDAFEAAL